jgi:hypothetical protein
MNAPRGIIAALALASCLLAPTQAVAATQRFWCSAGNHNCYFTIFAGKAMRNFTLQGGQSDTIGGLERGDTFCMSTSGPNNPNTCRRGSVF